MQAKAKPTDKRPKPTQTPAQVKYLTEKLRSLLTEFEVCSDLMTELQIEEIRVKNWSSGSNGIELVSNLAAEMTRELGRIKDQRILLGETKPRKRSSS